MDVGEFVPIGRLATDLGMDRSHARKYILAAGFTFLRIRTPETLGQQTLALSLTDAEAIKELRRTQGFNGRVAVSGNVGGFYVVQLVPDLDPLRVKLGFAIDPVGRLQEHRTAAPTAELIKAWPCRRSWEVTVMASLTRTGCTLIANEVFTCDSIVALVERGDTFFALMPDPA